MYAIAKFLESIRCLDRKHQCVLFFWIFVKHMLLSWHLLHKYQLCGINHKSLLWIKSFLRNRKQCVAINGIVSYFLSVECDVPRINLSHSDSFFAIYIKGLPQSCKLLKVIIIFAYDTNISAVGQSKNIFQDLNRLAS